MKRNVRVIAAVVAAMLAIFALMGEGSEDNKSSSSQENGGAVQGSSEGASSSSDVGKSQGNPAPVGGAMQVAKGWDVKVNSATLDANAIAAQANQFNRPDQGNQFVMVNVSVTNKSSDPQSPMMNIKLSLLPPTGVAIASYSAFVAQLPDALDLTAQMQPGATATGNVVFEVKSTDVPGSVLLAEPQFTMDTAKDQRFFAIQ